MPFRPSAPDAPGPDHPVPAAPAPGYPATDCHCHLLPGVDDGPSTGRESLAALTVLAAMGARRVWLTPHVYPGMFENRRARLESVFRGFRERTSGAIGLELRLAAEYHIGPRLLKILDAEPPLALEHGDLRLVLVEFPFQSPPESWRECFDRIAGHGCVPLLAHPERYPWMLADQDLWLERIDERGGRIQLTYGAFLGQHGRTARQAAQALWAKQGEAGTVLLGGDVHGEMDAWFLYSALKESAAGL